MKILKMKMKNELTFEKIQIEIQEKLCFHDFMFGTFEYGHTSLPTYSSNQCCCRYEPHTAR